MEDRRWKDGRWNLEERRWQIEFGRWKTEDRRHKILQKIEESFEKRADPEVQCMHCIHIITATYYTVTAFLLSPPLVDAVYKEFGRLPAFLPVSLRPLITQLTCLHTVHTVYTHIRIVFPFCCIPYPALSCQGMQTLRNIFKKNSVDAFNVIVIT